MEASDDRVYLRHIVDAIGKVERYVFEVSEEEFGNDDMRVDGVVRELHIVGEAARRLSRKLRSENNQIPWRKILGMRNKLVHDYMGVDLKTQVVGILEKK